MTPKTLPLADGKKLILCAAITDPLILDEGVMVKDAIHAIELYRIWLTGDYKTDYLKKAASRHFELIGKPKLISELRGKNLACFCKEGSSCHADILLKIANPVDNNK